jgi:hypothetical protein
MALQTSGAISLFDIQMEFGGGAPVAIDEYYRGGSQVNQVTTAGPGSIQTAPLTPTSNVLIPTSGTIQFSHFYGTKDVIVGDTGLIQAPAAGDDLSDYVEVTLPAGVDLIRLFLVGGGGGGGGSNSIAGGNGGGGSTISGTVNTSWAGNLNENRILRFFIGRGGANGFMAQGHSINNPAPAGGHGYGIFGVQSTSWGAWHNTYAVTTDMSGGFPVNNRHVSRMVHFPFFGSYQFQFTADNFVTIEINGAAVANTFGLNDQGSTTGTSFNLGSPLTRTVSVAPGWHKITAVYSNSGDIGSFAIRIMNGAAQMWTTRDEYSTWMAHPVGGSGGYAGSVGASGYGGGGGSATLVTLVTPSGEYFLACAGGGGGGGGGGDSGYVNVSQHANWATQGLTTDSGFPSRQCGGDGEYLGKINDGAGGGLMSDGGGGGGGGGGITNDRIYVSTRNFLRSGFGGRTARGNLVYNDTCADGGESGKSGISAFATRYADVMHVPTTSRFPILPTTSLVGTSVATLLLFGRGGAGATAPNVQNAAAGGNGAAYVDWGYTNTAVTAPSVSRAALRASIINFALTNMPAFGGAYSPTVYYFQYGTGTNSFALDGFGGGGNPGSEYTYEWQNISGGASLFNQFSARCAVVAPDGPGTAGQIRCHVSDGTSSAFTDFFWFGVEQDPPPIFDGGSTCFPAGSQVLMGDTTLKAIEQITVGDMVMGPFGPTVVIAMETPVLGNRKLLQFQDGHTWSEEHSHWTKSPTDGSQWWWSYNPAKWIAEVEAGYFGGLTDNNSIRTGNALFAHLDGWKSETPAEMTGESSMQLYLPMTNGVPIIVDGYLVGAGADQAKFNYAALDWDIARLNVLAAQPPREQLTVEASGTSAPPALPVPYERPPIIDPNFQPAPVVADPSLSPNVLP